MDISELTFRKPSEFRIRVLKAIGVIVMAEQTNQQPADNAHAAQHHRAEPLMPELTTNSQVPVECPYCASEYNGKIDDHEKPVWYFACGSEIRTDGEEGYRSNVCLSRTGDQPNDPSRSRTGDQPNDPSRSRTGDQPNEPSRPETATPEKPAPHPAVHMGDDEFRNLVKDTLDDIILAIQHRRERDQSAFLRGVPKHLEAAKNEIIE